MESRGKSVTKRHRKKWVDALSLVLPVLLFFAVLNCFTTYLYYQDYQFKMDILTEVAVGAETTGMDVAAGWLKGNDHQANEQGKQLLEQYGYWENKGTSFYVRFRQNIMISRSRIPVVRRRIFARISMASCGLHAVVRAGAIFRRDSVRIRLCTAASAAGGTMKP